MYEKVQKRILADSLATFLPHNFRVYADNARLCRVAGHISVHEMRFEVVKFAISFQTCVAIGSQRPVHFQAFTQPVSQKGNFVADREKGLASAKTEAPAAKQCIHYYTASSSTMHAHLHEHRSSLLRSTNLYGASDDVTTAWRYLKCEHHY